MPIYAAYKTLKTTNMSTNHTTCVYVCALYIVEQKCHKFIHKAIKALLSVTSYHITEKP